MGNSKMKQKEKKEKRMMVTKDFNNYRWQQYRLKSLVVFDTLKNLLKIEVTIGFFKDIQSINKLYLNTVNHQ